MRLVGLVLLILAVLCVLLPFSREALPFRVDLRNADADAWAVFLGIAGALALVGGRA